MATAELMNAFISSTYVNTAIPARAMGVGLHGGMKKEFRYSNKSWARFRYCIMYMTLIIKALCLAG